MRFFDFQEVSLLVGLVLMAWFSFGWVRLGVSSVLAAPTAYRS